MDNISNNTNNEFFQNNGVKIFRAHIKLERGVFSITPEGRLYVRSVGKLFTGVTGIPTRKHFAGQNVLGVVIRNVYHIGYNFIYKGKAVFGYYLNSIDDMHMMQLIDDFDLRNLSYDFYLKEYQKGGTVWLSDEDFRSNYKQFLGQQNNK